MLIYAYTTLILYSAYTTLIQCLYYTYLILILRLYYTYTIYNLFTILLPNKCSLCSPSYCPNMLLSHKCQTSKIHFFTKCQTSKIRLFTTNQYSLKTFICAINKCSLCSPSYCPNAINPMLHPMQILPKEL